ncbi:O-antigen ligase family protein [Chromobacterium subtsugae]|uniref:O-antigen ligase family protein n=1 Tax=Chromobacterium subtsugae TaxID=251747 RepID=UPI001364BC4C|nr:O-antigen ligase family protein [Chromobacterium subtsugae]
MSGRFDRMLRLLPYLFLLYPVMVIKYLWLGGGARFLTVLAPCVALLLLFAKLWRGERLSASAGELFRTIAPFIPFLLALFVLYLYHDQNLELYQTAVALIGGGLVYIAVKDSSLDEHALAIGASLFSYIYLAAASYEVFFLHRERAFGGVYENRFAEFCVLLIGFCVIYLNRHWKTLKTMPRNFVTMSVVVFFLTLVLTGSRGPFLAFPVLMIYLLAKHWDKKRYVFSFFALISFAALVLTYFYGGYLDHVKLAFHELFAYIDRGDFVKSSIGVRLELWKVSMITLSFGNFFGLGKVPFYDLAAMFPQEKAGILYLHQFFTDSGIPHPWSYHGDIPQMSSLGGIFMLMAYVAMLVMLLVNAKNNFYKIWLVSCAFVFGLSELFFFNRIGFAVFLTCWVLYSAFEESGKRRIGDS